jgi:hypothetical protein
MRKAKGFPSLPNWFICSIICAGISFMEVPKIGKRQKIGERKREKESLGDLKI